MNTLSRIWAGLAVAVSLTAGTAQGRANAPEVVPTDSGTVQGAVANSRYVFKGIPYAAPPVGPLRWKPPAPPVHADRDATHFGAACPQREQGRAPEPTSEDCLFLNVYTPKTGAAARLPVMVWIHGGGWTNGSGSKAYYDGESFSRDGVVLVTLNYRLGALGYFAHPALTAEAGPTAPLANYGQMDQIAALRWVQRNIAGFGGDPAKVTVFGESAGGGSILSLLATPSARGLFAQAVVESGPAWGLPKTLATQEAAGVGLATGVGLPAGSATASALRALPVEALLVPTGADGPIVDGRLVPVTVERAFASGRAIHVPMVIGTNADEGSLVLAYKGVGEQVLAALKPEELAAVQRTYAAEAADRAGLARVVFADTIFGAPSRWIAARGAPGAPVWLYRFSYVNQARRASVHGAQHGWEVPYVFDTLDRAPLQPAAADRAEAALVHGCWIAFAKTGRPSCPAPAAAWPAYAAASDTLMHFTDAGPTVVAGFRKPQYDLLQKIVTGRWAAAAKAITPSPVNGDH